MSRHRSQHQGHDKQYCGKPTKEMRHDSALACSSAPYPSDPEPPNLTTRREKTDIPTLLSADILALLLHGMLADPLLWNVEARLVPRPDFPGRLFFASLQLLRLLRLLAKPLRLLAFALAAPIV